MADLEDDPFNYSTIEIPTVVGLLKKVLSQYPDNGQILKELVQNAEDAGASVVEVVYDARDTRKNDITFHRSTRFKAVQKFVEAPSLYVYNNAEFNEEDWHGIRMLSDSIKQNDPLKVGQFGLGFKSVFHFTDVVTIISGNTVLFMDPSEPENKMCRDLPLAKLSTFMSEDECLHLWGTYLKKEHLQGGHMPGTIFWFPLRRKESKISATVYEQSNVERLFNSFSIEAPLCLIFLKSLERICIKKVSEHNAVSDILCVDLCDAGLADAQKKKRIFREQLKACKGFSDQTLTCSYDITVKTFVINQVINQQHFRVLQFLPGTSEEERGLHMPLVGIAAPLPVMTEDTKGQMFCFLPLPVESVNDTNLPIHINGYFVLDQNRRHIKWKTEESSCEADVMWNEDLVETVVADAYFLLLENVLKEVIAGSCSKSTWYNLLPQMASTKGRWRELGHKIWTKLLQCPVIYSEVKDQMLKPEEVISSANLASLSPLVAESVQRVLKDLDFPLATMPENILSTLYIMDAKPRIVTPKLLRDCLRNNSLKDGWNQLHLLEYVISDGQYDDLEGIPLLPLENGSWTSYSRYISPVYLCTADEAIALRGVEDQLLSTNLPEVVSVHMHKIASTGVMQLQIFEANIHTTDLLPTSVMYIQNSNYLNHQDIEVWLEMVWSLLQNVSLRKIENLSIVPSSGNLNPSSLISLSSAIIVRDSESQIPEAVFGALALLGNKVIPKLPTYVRHHELHSYLNRADSQGIHRSLQKVLLRQKSNNFVSNFNTKVTDEQRKAFSNVISEVQSLNPNVKKFLRRLCLFKAVEKTSVTDVSVEKVSKLYLDICDFPVSSPEPLISSADSNIHQLALRLGATLLSKEDLCILALQKDYMYSEENTKKLGWYVLNNSELHKSNNIQRCLRSVRFIPTSSGKLCMASELYDPMDTDIGALLGEKDLTPDKRYTEYNCFLKCLGLKKVQDMPVNEMVRVVKGVQDMQLSEYDRSMKIEVILKAIDQRRDCIQVCEKISSVRWVFGKSSRPTNYPKELQWATSKRLYSPNNLKSYDFKDIVGSCVPLICCEDAPNVARSFKWNVQPSVNNVVHHLTNVVSVCSSGNGIPESAYCEQLKKIYKNLHKFVGSFDETALFPLKNLPFVLTGYGFKLPRQVYIPSGKEDLQLLPYMHSLPVELCEYAKLFCFLGSFEMQSQQLYVHVLKQIQSQHNASGPVDADHDLEVVISVLQKMVKYKSEVDSGQLLLPVETDKDRLELVDINHCAYSDQNWEWLDGEELEVKVVHSIVDNKLAKDLGVEPLNNILRADEEAVMDEEDGMEWGQCEPLTTRIHNLLCQYRDGVAVLKELVQNADDAGATEISFLYDERQNHDACKRLITDQLKECQGPALWAYNNAKFTDTDFKNLRKLGGGTKEFLSTKIGKFGLGFCSVYNLTDVPSFVSGNNYVIFDPHETYLENNKRGARYNFSKKKNQIMLKKLDGQFKPYCNVFGCQIQETFSFDGTLFRLPFRTTTQASKSKISNQSYSHNAVTELLNMFQQIVSENLLFTQNIEKISVFYLDKNASPQEMELLYKSSRSEPEVMTILGDMCINMNKGDNQVQSVAQHFDNNHRWNGNIFQECDINDIKMVCTKKSSQLFEVEEGTWTVTWLTSWHSGNGKSCKLAENLGGKVLSLGAVAVPVEKRKNLWKLRNLKNLPCGFYKESHIHCFLPLPVKTSLPVQVNGFFEVTSDRTSLMTRTEDDRSVNRDWNSVLMSDAVIAAYLNLIDILRLKVVFQDALYFTVWPITNETSDELVIKLAGCFYDTIKEKDLKVFHNKNGWYPLSRSCFLANSFYNGCSIGSIAFEFMGELLKKENIEVMELDTGFEKHISDAVVTEEGFYNQYFFPNLAHQYIEQEKQNKLTLHVIDSQKPLHNELKEVPCIPTLPNGKLKKPCDLINPESKLANLFSISDERFPIDTFMEGNRSRILTTLGMRANNLDNGMILERMKTVDEISCLSCAVTRSSRIFQYLRSNEEQIEDVPEEMKSIPFVPVMSRPDWWPVKWGGDNCLLKRTRPCIAHANNGIDCLSFAAPTTVCSPELITIAGSTCLIQGQVNENKYGVLHKDVSAALGVIIHQDELPFMSVVNQLEEYCINGKVVSHEVLKHACLKIYEYLNNKARQNLNDLSILRNKKILLTKYGFVEPALFAMDESIDCAPALFSVQREDLHCFKHLMEGLGVKEQFSPITVFEILMQKKEQYQSTTLPEEEILLISNLLKLLFGVWENNGYEQLSLSKLCLPDSKSILCPVGELCIDDGANIDVGKYSFLHQNIYYSLAMLKWLGVEEMTTRQLLDRSHMIEFGQTEPLTTRLKNILKNYPCDSGIMKELLQNADDAGATEMAFIKDFRNLPTKKLFHEKWAPLQGPALCVYNNSCFNKTDLKWIQNLGDSCKSQDPASTGQYGIGFNAVYHLTDAPSFITRGKDVPGYETLCMFDPHCMYDPRTSDKYPGMRFNDLKYLRKVYPHSFEGYLEDMLKKEGTVFRLPLRTYKESKIGEVMGKLKLEKLLKQFKSELKVCLLFLRNVRKVSICSVGEDGKLCKEYCVESQISEEEKLSQIKDIVNNRKIKNNVFELQYLLNIERVTYEVIIKDTDNANYLWLIVQQFGSQNREALPEPVIQEFKEKRLRLFPQAGVAILLQSNQVIDTSLFSIFCYLPLPVQSGMHLCVNGHFALDNSRRNLWTGSEDFRAAWNEWLMKEVLAPAAAEAISDFRFRIFSKGKDLSLKQYENRIKDYYIVLPDSKKAASGTWKRFVSWFYQNVQEQKYPLFDVFVHEDDEVKKKGISVSKTFYGTDALKQIPEKTIKGRLTWHALSESESTFPMYFGNNNDDENAILGILKRLGMKVGSQDVYEKLKEAEIKVDVLNGENVLKFLMSWNSDCADKCQVTLMLKVENTPFLSIENVCKVFKYISSVENFSCNMNQLPLMVTCDMLLRCFDEQHPVFCTKYGKLLPEFNHEFLHWNLVTLIEQLDTLIEELKVTKGIAEVKTKTVKLFENYPNVMKHFTLDDLAVKLPKVLDETWYTQEERLPLQGYNEPHGECWIMDVWSFIVNEVKRTCKLERKDAKPWSNSDDDTDWEVGKKYLLRTLGEWCLYPVTLLRNNYVIQIKNASRALDVMLLHQDYHIFCVLPLPHPLTCIQIPKKSKYSWPKWKSIPENNLKLATTIEDPTAVLDVLYFYREEIASSGILSNSEGLNIVLWYFGKHCEKCTLSINKLRNLNIFMDTVGHVYNLVKKNLLVPHASESLHESILKLGAETNTIILSPASEEINRLYNYVVHDCIMHEIDVHTKFILPHLSLLPESEHIKVLSFLRDKLSHTQHKNKKDWSQQERDAVLRLERTPFLKLNGQLMTAKNFYNPLHSVFKVLKPSNLPREEWAVPKWKYFLQLAGMICELTGEMFVEFAKSLSITESDVKEKSEALADYLSLNYDKLAIEPSSIQNIEFLVPEVNEKLQKISPHLETESRMVSFSLSAPALYADLLWTTMSILPEYATPCLKWEELNGCDHVPEEKLFSHICKITSIMQATDEHIQVVMKRIYKHLESVKSTNGLLEKFVEKNVPLIHVADKGIFVTVDMVVIDLTEEIEPYLYKAPLRYGCYFDLFKTLGVCEMTKCDPYVLVLKKIHDTSQDDQLNFEQTRCMKLALENLANNMIGLQKIEAEVLYLPTKESKLAKSSEMYVSDNLILEQATIETLDKPIFIGLTALEVSGDDLDFVKQLPENLRPKLLSEVVIEELDEDNIEEVESSNIRKISYLIYSRYFQRGILRLLNHVKQQSESSLSEEEIVELQKKLDSVEVKAIKEILITLKLNRNVIGSKRKQFHVKVHKDFEMVTLYINADIEDHMVCQGLSLVYRSLFNVTDADVVSYFMGILGIMDKPQLICKFLDEMGIRPSHESELELYPTEVGTYLHLENIPLLDNEFCRFLEREVVVMKKYLSDGVESDDYISEDVDSDDLIYIIVQVKHHIKSADNIIFDEYEVFTENNENPHTIVKAYQLYKFIRTVLNDEVPTDSLNKEVEKSETEIMKHVRNQVKEIWHMVVESDRQHVLHRLYQIWHPDKNMNRTELCTSVRQYILSLVSRLKKGEIIPEDDDPISSVGTNKDSYNDIFRPHSSYTGGSSSRRANSNLDTEDFGPSERTKRPDAREARKWMEQAQHDLQAAYRQQPTLDKSSIFPSSQYDCDEVSGQCEGSPCWVIYMCHQAAEKSLKAALYLEDCEKACEFQRGPYCHSLTVMMPYIISSEGLQTLVQQIEGRVRNPNDLRYPTITGPPCNKYTDGDAKFVLDKAKMLLQELSPRF